MSCLTDSPHRDYNFAMRRKEEERTRRIIQDNLQTTLQVLEESINRVIDPSQVNAQTLFDYFLQKERIKTLDNMQPYNYLTAADHLEGWYRDRKLPYPHPERLEEIRSFWQERAGRKE